MEDKDVWVCLSVVSLLNKCETTFQSFNVASPQKPHVDDLTSWSAISTPVRWDAPSASNFNGV